MDPLNLIGAVIQLHLKILRGSNQWILASLEDPEMQSPGYQGLTCSPVLRLFSSSALHISFLQNRVLKVISNLI